MKRKTMLGIIIGGVCLLVLICVMLVGLADGVWHWEEQSEYPNLNVQQTEDTADAAESTDALQTGDTTEATYADTTAPSEGTNSQGKTQNTQTIPTEPSGSELPGEGDVQVEVDGTPQQTENNGSSTDQTEGTDGSTEPTDEDTQYLSFQDFLDLLKGEG